VPISLYEIPSQLHKFLRHYKSGKYPAAYQNDFSVRVVSILAYFVMKHTECIATSGGGMWDLMTTVPSSKPQIGVHALVTAIQRVGALRKQYEPLLRLGSRPVGHLQANDRAFDATQRLEGTRVLLIDDTYTTGATAQSAASALAIAGATVVAILPIGRVINPSFNQENKDYWERQRRMPFSFDTCCLESVDAG
jgi:hypothetical protein